MPKKRAPAWNPENEKAANVAVRGFLAGIQVDQLNSS